VDVTDMTQKYLDTYVLVEITRGNPKFAAYLTENFILSDLTLAEFYSVVLREQGEEAAEGWAHKLATYSEPVDLETLLAAVRFRRENKGTNMSFIDAVGYTCSRLRGYAFVTGDKAFEKCDGVEYVK